jgi:hypothetical protein
MAGWRRVQARRRALGVQFLVFVAVGAYETHGMQELPELDMPMAPGLTGPINHRAVVPDAGPSTQHDRSPARGAQ